MFFSVMFCFYHTVLNPSFIVSEINNVNFTTVVTHMMDEVWEDNEQASSSIEDADGQDSFDKYVYEMTIKTFSQLEPEIKTGIDISIHSLFDYLLDNKEDPEVAKMLRTSFFTKQFVSTLLNNLELDLALQQFVDQKKENPKLKKVSSEALSSLIDSILGYLLFETDRIDLKKELGKSVLNEDFFEAIIDGLDIPDHLSEPVMTSVADKMDATLPENMSFIATGLRSAQKPLRDWIRTTLVKNSGAVADYLVGKEDRLLLSVSIVPALKSIHPVMFRAFTSNLSGNLLGKSDSEVRAAFEGYMNEAFSLLTKDAEVDLTTMGDEFRSSFHALIKENESELEQQRDVLKENIKLMETELASLKEVVGSFVFIYNLVIFGIIVLLGMLLGLGFMKGETKSEKWKYTIRGPGLMFACTGLLQIIFIGSIQAIIVSELKSASADSTFLGAKMIGLMGHAMSSTTWLSITFLLVGGALVVGSLFLPTQKDDVETQST